MGTDADKYAIRKTLGFNFLANATSNNSLNSSNS